MPNRITRLLIREKARPAQPLQPRFREKVRPAPPIQRHFREKTRPAGRQTPILWCFERAGRTFSRSHTHQATQGERFRAQDPAHGDFETNDTSTATDAGQHETTITTARPQQGTAATDIASAPENCTKNTHLAPAKAMAVSVEAQPARAKATPVSRERFQMMVGGGRAWPGDQWAADVTNVVKPEQFEPPLRVLMLQTSSICVQKP